MGQGAADKDSGSLLELIMFWVPIVILIPLAVYFDEWLFQIVLPGARAKSRHMGIVNLVPGLWLGSAVDKASPPTYYSLI